MNIVVEKVMDRFVKPGLTWDMNPDDDNLFHCTFCGEKYKKLNILRKHQKTPQQVVDIDDAIVDKDQLTCQLCNKTYKRNSSLRKHIERNQSFQRFKTSESGFLDEEDHMERYNSVGLNFNDTRKVGHRKN